MPFDRFLIAPLRTGVQLNTRPWIIMDDAFQSLANCRLWRERLMKRFGAKEMNTAVANNQLQLFSRFRINIGNTDADTGDFAPFVVPGTVAELGQIFSIGTTIFTVIVDNGDMLTTGEATGTFDIDTQTVTITGNNENPNTIIYFYPAQPVMALPTYEQPEINNEQLFGFDTQFAYSYVKSTGWNRLGDGIWTGTDSDFHSCWNYRGTSAANYYFFVVNNVPADEIQYWDGANWNSITPAYLPTVDDVEFNILTAQIVVSFKNRLLLFGTTEVTGADATATFANRVRYSQNGNPIQDDAFREDIAGKGGFLNADTKESVTSVEFLKDRLIVWFERSCFELVYTNNEILPFRFQKINTELGVEALNSIIPFDKVVLGFGSTGIHQCNGINVERIDSLIPSEIFDINNSNGGPQRITGIRDYFTEEVYWSYCSSEAADANSDTYPNRVLVYNYKTGAWSFNDDSITAFGYYQDDGNLTWADLNQTWQESGTRWNDPSLTSLFRKVVCGNQQGFTFLVESDDDAEKTSNSISLSIANVEVNNNVITLTVINHNITTDDESENFIYIDNIMGIDPSMADVLNETIWKINSIVDDDTITILYNTDVTIIIGNYIGGGTIKRVSQLFAISKQYNFYNKIGKKIHVPQIDFLIDSTENGAVQVDYMASFSPQLISQDGIQTGAVMGINVLETIPLTPFEQTQDMFWRSMYTLLDGETIQYQISVSDEQMLITDIAFSDFQLHAVLFYAQAMSDFGN